MGGSWDSGQEPNVAGGEEEPLSCGGSQGLPRPEGKVLQEQGKVHSESQAGQGWQGPLEFSWLTPGPRAVSCCSTLWDVTGNCIVLCYAVRILLVVFSPSFRASDDIKVLSSGFSEEERKMSAFLNSKTTRSSRGTSSLFYCIEKNTLHVDVV